MKPTLLASFLALPLALAADDLAFAPETGSELTKSFTWTHVAECEASSTTLDGEATTEVPSVRPNVERTIEVTVVDTHVETADGRPVELVRRFEDTLVEVEAVLGIEMMGTESELEYPGEGISELDGLAARFRWNDETDAYDVTWADDDDGDVDLLRGLDVDMDYLGLLPDDTPEAGDEWEVDPAEFARHLLPGGELAFDYASEFPNMDGVLDPVRLPSLLDVLRAGEVGGEVVARYEGSREADGAQLGTMRFEVELEVAASFTDEIQGLVDEAAPADVEAEVIAGDYAAMVEGTATLVWNLGAGRVHAFAFEGDTALESELAVEVDTGQEVVVFEQLVEQGGELECTCEVR